MKPTACRGRILNKLRSPWVGWMQVVAAAMMALSPLPCALAVWVDTDSDGANDTWIDPELGQPSTLAEINAVNVDADGDGATNDEEAAEGSDPYRYDTDLDGLSDGDELHLVQPILGVSLTNWDSNGNEISDHDEWHSFYGVTYPGGELPSYPGASYSDYDGDGWKNHEDPYPHDPDNGTTSDDDGDGIMNINDPYPTDSSNYSDFNQVSWFGDLFGDADEDGTANWEDPEPYVVGSSGDSDWDGIPDDQDPFPNDDSNYSATNGVTWYGDINGDADSDGIVNWMDLEPYGSAYDDSDGDGIMNGEDPFPEDATNYSLINGVAWYDLLFTDDDLDTVVNWQDSWPSDPYNGNPPPSVDNDGDGLTEAEEISWGTDDWDVDCDDDGLTDYEELIVYHTPPRDAYYLSGLLGWGTLYLDYQMVDQTDTDGDGIPDRIEEFYGMLPNNTADGPGDLDGNGMSNLTQYNAGLALNVDLGFYDADGDGLTDVYEDYYGMDKNSFDDAMDDLDMDGVLNYEESKLLLSPTNADTLNRGGLGDMAVLMEALLYPEGGEPLEDADSDGIPDWQEAALAGSSPVLTRVGVADLDGDGMPDVWEHQYGRWKFPSMGLYARHDDAAGDPDGDNLTNLQEYLAGTHPFISDTDGDETSDADEDGDGDGLSNAEEFAHGLNPTNPDTDGDGMGDADEVAALTDADLDGTKNDEEIASGRDPNWKDHPAVELVANAAALP